METNFNFKSQIATSREQSERLLALGLKRETADMTHHYLHSIDSYELKDIEFSRIMHLQDLVNKKPVLGRNGDDLYAKDIPAWSLHRLIEMIQDVCSRITMVDSWVAIENRCMPYIDYRCDKFDNTYDNLIDCIEWLIKEGYFNKEYLEE